jgi:hypothetical protein
VALLHLFPREGVQNKMNNPMDSTFLIGLILFVLLMAVVFGAFTLYRRNIKPGAEDTDPNKFSQ